MLRQQYMEKLAGWRADRLILSMNQLQMSVQVIESLGGRQKGLHLMNIDYSTVLNVGLSFRHTLWMVSLLGKFFKVLLQWSYSSFLMWLLPRLYTRWIRGLLLMQRGRWKVRRIGTRIVVRQTIAAKWRWTGRGGYITGRYW